MIIEPLTAEQLPRLQDILSGYTTNEKYRIEHRETVEEISFQLKLVSLPAPVTVSFDYIGAEELERYAGLIGNGCCFATLVDGQLIGATVAEPQEWNLTLWVWEILVDPAFKRQGVGRMLMERLIDTAVSRKLRAIVCETQSQNLPAIRFYRSMGFLLDGIDVSYYTNEDYDPRQNVAIFMKRKI